MGEAALVRCDEVIATPRRMGAGLLGQQEWGCSEDLGAHPKLGALVGALLECCFLLGHPYLAIGAQVGALLELLSLKDSSHDLQANCAISFCFHLYLMLHAYARFDVTRNLERILVFRVN